MNLLPPLYKYGLKYVENETGDKEFLKNKKMELEL